MFFDVADSRTLITLAALSAIVVAVTVTAFGHLRDCSGQHAGAGPGATTVAYIQSALTAEAKHRAAAHAAREVIQCTETSSPDLTPSDEYIGRHRLHDPDETNPHGLSAHGWYLTG